MPERAVDAWYKLQASTQEIWGEGTTAGSGAFWDLRNIEDHQHYSKAIGAVKPDRRFS